MNKAFGYARVSSREQNEARQLMELSAFGIGERDIFIDKASGKSFDREKYKALLVCLRPGDTLVVCSLDRLGRDYEAIIKEWQALKELGVQVVVLDMPILNTTSGAQGLDRQFISDLVLQILSYVAQKERENIRERQRQGIEAAKQRGKKLGRPSVVQPKGFSVIYERWKAGNITARAAMELLQLRPTSFYKLVKEYERDLL